MDSNISSNQALRHDYTARINRVIDYVEHHIHDDLTLGVLAGVAGFSPFHFHRIFRVMTGEPLNRFIQRLRVEKAASKLLTHPDMPVTEIALDLGFSGSAAFARAFKENYGMSASQWRKGGFKDVLPEVTDEKVKRLQTFETDPDCAISRHLDRATRRMNWRITQPGHQPVTVSLETLPETEVAYVRHIGPYQGDSSLFQTLYDKLVHWAVPRNLMHGAHPRMFNVYHDDPGLTQDNMLRLSVCLAVPQETKAQGEVGRMTLAGGLYGVARFSLSVDEYPWAWTLVYGVWLPQSGLLPADGPCFERYVDEMENCDEGRHWVEICVPVKGG